MAYLLDTHVLLWWLDANSPLKPEMRQLIDGPNSRITVSVASIWEISIKKSLGRLEAPDDILALLELNRIDVLPITAEQAYAVRSLPPLHGDPFDRMLVVQALLENLTIITHDKNIQAYAASCKMV